MNWYVADKGYINYLKKFDSRVGYVDYGDHLKLHLGIILELEKMLELVVSFFLIIYNIFI